MTQQHTQRGTQPTSALKSFEQAADEGHVGHLERVNADASDADGGEDSQHWSPEELASFASNPGHGRVLNVRLGTSEPSDIEQTLREAGYCLGRLPITRDPSHLPQAAASFMPDVIYVTIGNPIPMCINALEALAVDPKTKNLPLVALVPEDAPASVIEEAYTRSGCDFFRIGATAIELLARTHLLVRLSNARQRGMTVQLHEAPLQSAANSAGGTRLDLRDPATGVYAATYFRHRLPTETARAIRYQRSLSLVAIRAPQAARDDEVAVRVAQVIATCCRHIDLVARIEKDLFVVLLPETEDSGTGTVVGRLRSELSSAGIVNGVGFAVLGEDEETHDSGELLQTACIRADEQPILRSTGPMKPQTET